MPREFDGGGEPRAVVVCIPARNEAERLPDLLQSLDQQRGIELPLRVAIVANNCSDDTLPLLRGFERDGVWAHLALRIVGVDLEAPHAHVGTARRMAMDLGVEWLDDDGCPDGVLITTDADAVAPPDWVAANLRALASAEVIGGRLCMEPGSGPAQDLHARIERYWSGVRAMEDALDPPPHDPAPRHGDHTAGSLAMPISIYRAAGGLPALPCGEDNALVQRIRWLGGRLRHCPDVRIAVSARTSGRVLGGMASEMMRRADLIRSGDQYRLPSADLWLRQIERRAALRAAWHNGIEAMKALDLNEADLAAIEVETCPNDIAFVERAMQRRAPEEAPLIDIDEANRQIDAILLGLGSGARGRSS